MQIFYLDINQINLEKVLGIKQKQQKQIETINSYPTVFYE